MDRKMTELDDAVCQILEQITPLEALETVSLDQVLGRVLAKDVVSSMNVPAFDNSAMDGYALNSASLKEEDLSKEGQNGTPFEVSQRIPAGSKGETLQTGTVARIFTGAPVPEGADMVIQQEHAEVQEDGRVVFTHLHTQGDNIRLAGEDIAKDAVVIPQGQRMRIVDVGSSASIGQASFSVYRKPKVALFVTGDELTEPGETLKPGHIYNSNRYLLRALLEEMGCEVSDQGIIRDTLESVKEHLADAAKSHDLVLTTGGVSVGEEDHVKNAVTMLGEIMLWKLAFKPGKPLAFGQIRRQEGMPAWFLGLPGNPVAVFIAFLLVVGPFLQKLGGATPAPLKTMRLRANFAASTKGRREFLRAKINAQGEVELYPNQSSGVLTSIAWADGFVDVPAKTIIQKGDEITYVSMSHLLES